MYWKNSFSVIILALLVIVNGHQESVKEDHKTRIRRHEETQDLETAESENQQDLNVDAATHLGRVRQQSIRNSEEKYSSRIKNKNVRTTEPQYGFRTTVRKTAAVEEQDGIKQNETQVLDFRINDKGNSSTSNYTKARRKPVKFFLKPDEVRDAFHRNVSGDMKAAEASNGKSKKETDSKKGEDEEEKTLSQQVADGKYGLIQKELFSHGSKRPGIISYLPNPEVPGDTKENFGGLDKDEIWLAEDHVLVLKGGIFPEQSNGSSDSSSWPPIDDYEAPPRQVKIPKRPKIPPPFPVQLSDNGPLEFIKGANGSGPPSFPFFQGPPPNGLPPPGTGQPFPGQGFPYPPPNGSFPYPPPNAYLPLPNMNNSRPLPPLPPFLANLPPGAAFLPPPGNVTDFDEDDPSIYYPPPYDFYYPKDNTTAVPPGPLVPGIILPPPPNFFAPLHNDTDDNYDVSDEENETGHIDSKQYQGPVYLPVPQKPTIKRPYTRRPYKRPNTSTSSLANDISNQIHGSTSSDTQTTVKPRIQYIYPTGATQKPQFSNTFRTQKIATAGDIDDVKSGLTSPIYVPNSDSTPIYHPLPTTSPKPNHITLPKTDKNVLPQEIYVVAKPGYVEKVRGDQRRKNQTKSFNKYENIPPNIHPLRSLIRPNVTVSYVGKYGHLPMSIAAPTSAKEGQQNKVKSHPPRGHYITTAPRPVYTRVNDKENEVNSITPIPPIHSVSVTSISEVTRNKLRPTTDTLQNGKKSNMEMTSPKPSKATFYFYEEPVIDKGHLQDIPPPSKVAATPKPQPLNNEISSVSPVYTKTTRFPTVDINKETPNYYSTITATAKTPIRQFLEETFHASNVLPNKPQTSHYPTSSHFEPGFYHEVRPQTKLNYANVVGPTTKPQMVKYEYVTEIPKENKSPETTKNVLEIEHAGLSGVQKVNPAPVITSAQVTPKPYNVAANLDSFITVQDKTPGDKFRIQLSHSTTTPKPDDGPFIPSNYYATANPQDLYLTPQDHTILDDITKNYFTIFGQKIVQSTTPLTPAVAAIHQGHQNVIKTPQVSQENVYISEKPVSKPNAIVTADPNYRLPSSFHTSSYKPEKNRPTEPPVQYQVTRRPPFKALKPTTLEFTTKKPRPFVQIVTPTRAKSNFEQYLKEITGEDQRDYVEVMPTRGKKPKANLGFQQEKPNYVPNLSYNPISIYLNPPNPPRQMTHPPTGLSQYLIEVSSIAPPLKNSYSPSTSFAGLSPPKYKYIPSETYKIAPYINNFSTTVKPTTTIEIEPQFVQHVSSTARPLDLVNTRPIVSSTLRPHHDFRQFLQEISTFTSPTTLRPIRIKNPPHIQYVNELQYTSNAQEPNKQKPISIESDILVNYKPPLPQSNPDAELIDIHKPQPFEQNSNFKIVDPPDLSKGPPRQYIRNSRPNNKQLFESSIPMNPTRAKEFFQNLPQSGYFNPVDHSFGNSFISYNLPGNGGHFYFLTPQAVERSEDGSNDSQEDRNSRYTVIKRSDSSNNSRKRGGKVRSSQPSRITEEYPQHGFSNQDYLRRRRKKT